MVRRDLPLSAYRDGERAVSPVIGVILMVAITVILAAVIGAFVMGIGGEQASAPNANLEMGQNDVVVQGMDEAGNYGARGPTEFEVPAFHVRHGGGEVINKQNIQLTATIHFSGYTDGNISNHEGVLGTVNQSRTAPADQQLDYTHGGWNNRVEESIEAPAETEYTWWLNADQDVIQSLESGWGNHYFDPVAYRDMVYDPAGECAIWKHGNPRAGYVDGSGERLGGGGANEGFGIHRDTVAKSWGGSQGDDIDWMGVDGPCPMEDPYLQIINDDERPEMEAIGSVAVGDQGRVIWSPPDVDQSQQLAEHELR